VKHHRGVAEGPTAAHLEAFVALAVIATAFLYPSESAVTIVRFIRVVLIKTGVHACLAGRFTEIFGQLINAGARGDIETTILAEDLTYCKAAVAPSVRMQLLHS
jgi:hypothetical protein